MISFCIPIKDYNVTDLATELDRQASLIDWHYEIILIDDFSSEFKDENSKLQKIDSVQYIELKQNIGRARIRNLFLNYSRYNYLLFFDCDSVVLSDGFVKGYYAEMLKDRKVVCGGRIYPDKLISKEKKLHWKYGTFRESMPVTKRNADPNKSFMTNNFLIKKSILDDIRFDERITEYGHEDTLFGYYLNKNGIRIHHIDNPVLHGSMERNSVFITKTQLAIINLLMILKYVDYDNDFVQSVSILKFYYKNRSKGLIFILNPAFILLCPIIKLLLKSGFVNLTLFNFYKLGFLITNSNVAFPRNQIKK